MGDIKINGNNNRVFSQVKNSKIIGKNMVGGETYGPKRGTWIAILIAVLTLIATCIIGWDEIVKFFNS
ncbi:MAG: hypothetical protein IJ534_01805 [Bacteroidaceae bacterium]|nr:hypothetical protein [Bacteroidaceae bacterium]